MKIKFIQVNIYKGKFLDELVSFLKKEDADIISAQEVTCGRANFYKDRKTNLFEVLKHRLGFYGVFHSDLEFREWPEAKFGNAVFSKFLINTHRTIVLNTFRAITYDEIEGAGASDIRPRLPRHIIDAQLDIDGKQIHAISWHGAWTAPPSDTPETLRQARVVSEYLKNLEAPFILGCDVNNVPGSKTIGLIDDAAVNLMIGEGIVQTTHPRVHKIVPRGFLVDYIFTSHHFKLLRLQVPEVLVSDHLPVVAELEL